MARYIAAVVLLVALVNKISGHESHLGHCPWIPAVPHFDAEKFVGNWYAVQKTPPLAPCVTYHVAETPHDHDFILTEYSELAENKYKYKIGADLSIVFPDDPGKLLLQYQNSLLGYRYHVFATDYHHYAGVFICQNFGIFHRSSIVLLSRNRTLDQHYLDELLAKLNYYHVSLEGLTEIDQHSCLTHNVAHTVQESEVQQVDVEQELGTPQIVLETEAPVIEVESQAPQIESEVNDPVIENFASQGELEASLPEAQGELEATLPEVLPTHPDEHHDHAEHSHDHHLYDSHHHNQHHSDGHEKPQQSDVQHHIPEPEIHTDVAQQPQHPEISVPETPILPETVPVEQSPEQVQISVSEGADVLPAAASPDLPGAQSDLAGPTSLDLSGAQSDIAGSTGAIAATHGQIPSAGEQETIVIHHEVTGAQNSPHTEHIEKTTQVVEGHDEVDCPHPSHSIERKDEQTSTHQELSPTAAGKVDGEIVDPRGELQKTDSQIQEEEGQVEIGTFFPSEGEDVAPAVVEMDVQIPYSQQQMSGMIVEEPTAKISTRNIYFKADAKGEETPDPYWDSQDTQVDFVETYATLLKLQNNNDATAPVSGLGQ